MTLPEMGDFGVVATGGWVAACIRWVTKSSVNHAVLYVGGGQIVEGDPKGAQLSSVHKFGDRVHWANWPLTDAQRLGISTWGHEHVGTRYNYLDDAEIAFVDLFGWAPKWMRNRLRSDSTLMCSQLVDAAYAANGVQLFADKRPAGGVSPGDLGRLIGLG